MLSTQAFLRYTFARAGRRPMHGSRPEAILESTVFNACELRHSHATYGPRGLHSKGKTVGSWTVEILLIVAFFKCHSYLFNVTSPKSLFFLKIMFQWTMTSWNKVVQQTAAELKEMCRGNRSMWLQDTLWKGVQNKIWIKVDSCHSFCRYFLWQSFWRLYFERVHF